MSYGAGMEGARFHHYLGVLYKRRWIAITAFLAVLLFAINVNFTAVPIYEASVRVLLQAERLNLVKVQDVIDQRQSLEAELAILRSRWLAKKTLTRLALIQAGLNDDGSVTKNVDGRKDNATGSWWSTVKIFAARAFGSSPPPQSSEPLAGERPAETRQIDGFLAGLALTLTADGVLDIKYRSADPVTAARFANAHAQEYLNENLETRIAAVQEVADWLVARLAEQKQKLDASEQTLQRFREQNELITAEGSPVVVSKLNELSTALTRAQASRFDKEATYNRALALRANADELDRLPQMVNNAALQQLRPELERLQRERSQLARTLREQHPKMVELQDAIQTMQAKLDVERSRVLEAMREDLGVSRAAENNLAKSLESLKGEATSQNRKSLELSILAREASSNREIYDMFMQRARETSVAKDINPNRIRILDAATVPSSPAGLNKSRNIFVAIVVGLGLAFLLAFGFERLDNRIKCPEEISDRLGLAVVGFLPEVKLKEGVAAPLVTNGASPEFFEEFRRIRMNVLFSLAADGPRSLAITSTGPSEGKTVVASNLAILLAQAGERVLVIDGDMRRPTTHTHFGISQEPGLSNVLVGSTKASDAVKRSAVANLWILPAGRCPPNPADLLGSREFKKLLAATAEHFDWVLIDTPPVMAVTDACVVAQRVTATLFVARAETVSCATALRALEQLTKVNAKLIGGILSRVNVGRYGRFYSSYYGGYDRKYREYYTGSASSS